MIALYTEGYGYSKRLCRNVVNWFVSKHLPRHKLDITVLHRSLKSDGAYGYCDVAHKKDFLLQLFHTYNYFYLLAFRSKF